jgi:hypothetical protein
MSTVLLALAVLSLVLLVEGHMRLRRVLARRPAPPPFPATALHLRHPPGEGAGMGRDNIRAFSRWNTRRLSFVVDSGRTWPPCPGGSS